MIISHQNVIEIVIRIPHHYLLDDTASSITRDSDEDWPVSLTHCVDEDTHFLLIQDSAEAIPPLLIRDSDDDTLSLLTLYFCEDANSSLFEIVIMMMTNLYLPEIVMMIPHSNSLEIFMRIPHSNLLEKVLRIPHPNLFEIMIIIPHLNLLEILMRPKRNPDLETKVRKLRSSLPSGPRLHTSRSYTLFSLP
ncbi:hypothetical protein DPMN_096481 [Dreissena polymorpha]|uniref:Uncharacterized protein n=1 Tax=Dreissena polymorpha TaxID=45954 RepID=A0A9D4L8T3_DREPO|nr:hypothetical protein DPMN_096481 [Dreissena polymorpha]